MKKFGTILLLACILLLSIVVGGLYAGSRRVLEGLLDKRPLTNDMCSPAQGLYPLPAKYYDTSNYTCNSKVGYYIRNGQQADQIGKKKSNGQPFACAYYGPNSPANLVKFSTNLKAYIDPNYNQTYYACDTDGFPYYLKNVPGINSSNYTSNWATASNKKIQVTENQCSGTVTC